MLLYNIKHTISWVSKAFFSYTFKVLQETNMEDMHLRFSDAKYKAL